jgi:hypothetical protein
VVDARGARIVPGPAPALRDGGRAQGAGSSHDNTPVVIEPSATLPPHVIVVPLTTDAASGRSGEAVTPSPDAEGRVRLRPPSAGVGEPGDPAFTVQAHGAPAVFEARVARNGRGAPAPIVPPVKAESGDTGKGDSAPLVVGLAQITSRANRANPKPGDPAATLPNRGQLLAYDALNQAETGEVGHTIRAGTDHGHGHQSVPHVVEALAYRPGHPRRLTPTECERLQSFPDGWTCTCGADPYTTETCRCKDSPRYRSLGNAVAVVCVLWILARLDRVAEMEAAA